VCRIVVIDDEPVLRLTFRHILQEEGHEVWDAGNGRSGLALCRETNPDLVITDVIMPEQEGIATIKTIHAEFPEMAIIVMSGTEAGLKHYVAPDETNVAFMPKPVDRPALLKRIESLLANRHSLNQGDRSGRARDGASNPMQQHKV
jgi:DNA-binding NtrC family response regulator